MWLTNVMEPKRRQKQGITGTDRNSDWLSLAILRIASEIRTQWIDRYPRNLKTIKNTTNATQFMHVLAVIYEVRCHSRHFRSSFYKQISSECIQKKCLPRHCEPYCTSCDTYACPVTYRCFQYARTRQAKAKWTTQRTVTPSSSTTSYDPSSFFTYTADWHFSKIRNHHYPILYLCLWIWNFSLITTNSYPKVITQYQMCI